MAESDPIVRVQPGWALEPEDMGTKEKFWYREPDDPVDWLFKRPRPGSGEHWAEKIAAEVAEVLGVPHATVELAVLQEEDHEQRGSASQSFVSDEQDLFHGNQLLEWTTPGYDPNARHRQSDHSFANIWKSFERIFVHREGAEETKTAFARCLTLDAVIGNVDRHHENWGLLRRQDEEREQGWLAPSFDHASSLGRELRDGRRSLLLREKRVGAYSEKGRGQIFWSEEAPHPPSPLQLVRMAVVQHPLHFGPALKRLARLRESRLTEIVDCVPDDWMSPVARAFAIELISYNRTKLMELNR